MQFNNLKDYIVVLDNILSDSVCDKILEEYSQTEEWQQTVVGNGEVRKDIRSASTIQMSADFVVSRNAELRREIDSDVFAGASKAIQAYNANFEHCRIEEDSGYELLRYETGQFYTQHTDSFKARLRAVSCSFSLNDDYEGGEFGFFDRELVIRASKGGAVLFPSNFMYPHEIMPVTKGSRYSIITWFI
jgi:predicted 2-oxoglutarate/Fe(II)-dependent dioxygenase YbiX